MQYYSQLFPLVVTGYNMKIVTQDFTAEMLHSSDAPFVCNICCANSMVRYPSRAYDDIIVNNNVIMCSCTCAYIYSRNVNYIAPVAIMSRIIYLAMQDSHKNLSKCDTWQLISQQLYITLFAAWQIAIIKIQAIKTQRVQIRKA